MNDNLVKDALFLLENKRFNSAFLLALVAVQARAEEKYNPEHKPRKSGQCFKRFFQENEIKFGNITIKKLNFVIDAPDLPALESTGKTHEELVILIKEHNQKMKEYNQKILRFGQKTIHKGKEHPESLDELNGFDKPFLSKPRFVTAGCLFYHACRCQLCHLGILQEYEGVKVTIGKDHTISKNGNNIELGSDWIGALCRMAL